MGRSFRSWTWWSMRIRSISERIYLCDSAICGCFIYLWRYIRHIVIKDLQSILLPLVLYSVVAHKDHHYPFLKVSKISCLGQNCTQLSQCSLVWKGVGLINIDYNPPSASKNWLLRFLIWMPLCLDFNISVTFQWQKQRQRLHPLLKSPSYLQAPLRKTLVILLVLLYHPMGRSFVSTASNCWKLSVSTFGPCSMLHFLLREEQWYWFWIVRENARDISKELREHNT